MRKIERRTFIKNAAAAAVGGGVLGAPFTYAQEAGWPAKPTLTHFCHARRRSGGTSFTWGDPQAASQALPSRQRRGTAQASFHPSAR